MLERTGRPKVAGAKTKVTKTANLNIRTNVKLKESVGSILHSLGLTHSSAVELYYRQILSLKRIPFSIEIPNEETREAIAELRTGKKLKKYKSVEEMFEDLEG